MKPTYKEKSGVSKEYLLKNSRSIGQRGRSLVGQSDEDNSGENLVDTSSYSAMFY
uniref:Uncharacterized protein n=1 Tax=Arion vulgaris TaxID=1028688 RepID=A0A0B7AQ39_9EUPU